MLYAVYLDNCTRDAVYNALMTEIGHNCMHVCIKLMPQAVTRHMSMSHPRPEEFGLDHLTPSLEDPPQRR